MASLKSQSQNSNQYWSLINYLFDPADGANAAGMTYLRVPLGATDFSASAYTYDDTSGDIALNDFNISASPSDLFSTISDILSVNKILKIHVCPWSPDFQGKGILCGRLVLSFSDTLIIGYEHNWDDAGKYPVQLMEDYASPFDGLSFRCYTGAVGDQVTFHNAYPEKNVYFTEYSRAIGSD
ncbi:hypothetical protein C8Q72DRAFT_799039 [Fomitopsis betulina]|nr:hypothetical protein C8Q72DRAFT_799039 [Fomitopsis betulina]